MLTPTQRLELANHILSSDAAFEADCVGLDVVQNHPVTEREKAMGGVINTLYKLIHPSSSCRHPDWEEENERRYNQMKGE